ncbi:TonB-dependent receptor [Sphingobacterium deserti]|uniref:TonB-dependent siderophore receptor n=1 Tax=Sphingobacterium deserti TaxID=1229276 RepID=A0A0B8SYR9_9SPHI|nr:TonB-dependent receptor [Sphingobacterium deserti]KGE12301.1 TonB-dependent siderophore receptor [Sphingobacterium deserti]
MCKVFLPTSSIGHAVFLFILTFFLAATLKGQDGLKSNRQVIVRDVHGNALPGITISIAGYADLQTDSHGRFIVPKTLKLPVKATFKGVGFETLVRSIDDHQLQSPRAIVVVLSQRVQQVDEVLVTGRRNNSYLINNTELGGKFSGSLKDLPQSVSIVSKEFMEDKQAFVITDMVQDLAGVNQASSYDDVTIRGFNSGYMSGLRLVNGMRSGYGYGTSFWRTPLTVNLESIEILKGPGASLFGDITPGGTINLVTKKPKAAKHASINFSVGSFETYRTTLDVGGAVDTAGKVLYRLNVGYENARTFRDVNQRKSMLLAPSFSFRPVDGTQLDVDLTYDNFDGYLDRGLGIRGNDFYGQPRSFNVNQPTDFLKTSFLTMAARLSQRLSSHMSLHVRYMKSIYSENLNEFRTLNTFADAPANTIMNMRFQSKQARDYTDNVVSYVRYSLQGRHIQHEIAVGVDYARYAGDADNLLREARSSIVNGQEVPLTIDLENPNRNIIDVSTYVWRPQAEFPFLNPYNSLGLYVQDQITIADRLKLILGLRHEYYRSSSADLQNTFETSQRVWLPRLGLTYKLNEQVNYFASYSQGYVPVGADFIHNYQNYGANEPFQAERSFQVETGFKTGFFRNQLQTELSLFHIGRQNMLVPTGELTDTGFPVYRQSGEVLSRGVELDFRGQVTPEFQVMANYTFNQTRVVSSSLTGEEGQPLGNAPKNMGGIWLKYVFSKNVLKGLGFGAGIYYVDQRRMDNAARIGENGMNVWDMWPAYSTVNTALYYHKNGMKIALNVNNIFDRYYYVGGFDYTRGFVGTPRNVMLSFGYSLW